MVNFGTSYVVPHSSHSKRMYNAINYYLWSVCITRLMYSESECEKVLKVVHLCWHISTSNECSVFAWCFVNDPFLINSLTTKNLQKQSRPVVTNEYFNNCHHELTLHKFTLHGVDASRSTHTIYCNKIHRGVYFLTEAPSVGSATPNNLFIHARPSKTDVVFLFLTRLCFGVLSNVGTSFILFMKKVRDERFYLCIVL